MKMKRNEKRKEKSNGWKVIYSPLKNGPCVYQSSEKIYLDYILAYYYLVTNWLVDWLKRKK